jgi:transcriptional regulator with XRE-family HTH domain
MSRSTPDDDAFKRRVAREFIRARDRALGDGWSMEEFVQRLGITRAAFHKHVTGKAIPSLRVLNKARKYWGVQLSYGELGDGFIKTKKKDPRQMEFQFSLTDISKEQIEVKRFSPKGEKAVELLIKIDFSKSA